IAHMGIGESSGDNRATEAAEQAIKSPLLETSIEGAKSVLLNITGGPDLGIFEVNEAADLIRQSVDEDANIIFGAGIDDNIDDQINITDIATGFNEESSSETPKKTRRTKEEVKEEDDENEDDFLDDSLDELDIPIFLRRKGKNNNIMMKNVSK